MINYKKNVRDEVLPRQEIKFATGTTDIEILERSDNTRARIRMQFNRLLCPPNTQY